MSQFKITLRMSINYLVKSLEDSLKRNEKFNEQQLHHLNKVDEDRQHKVRIKLLDVQEENTKLQRAILVLNNELKKIKNFDRHCEINVGYLNNAPKEVGLALERTLFRFEFNLIKYPMLGIDGVDYFIEEQWKLVTTMLEHCNLYHEELNK